MGERPLGTVLVTGAASGLGAATALAVADRGGRVLAIDRVPPPPEVEDAVADVEVADLADARAAEAAVRALADRAGGLDAVFTPAGTDKCGTLAEVDGADWDRVVLVNLLVSRDGLTVFARLGDLGPFGQGDLTLEANRVRQAEITQEIMEVVAGADAQTA